MDSLILKTHQHMIAELVEELRKPEQEVAEAFSEEFDKLDQQAKIKAFLPLIARRAVKARLTAH